MNVLERLILIKGLFARLENTPGRNDKEYLVKQYKTEDVQLSKDIDFAFEVLCGRRKIGFTINISNDDLSSHLDEFNNNPNMSLEEYLKPIYEMTDHSDLSIHEIEQRYKGLGTFLNPILNREWRIGINNSQLEIEDISPMLAKKFSYDKLPPNKDKRFNEIYYITEKLDGNRCLARYNIQLKKWEFYSRSGRRHKVSFDMGNLPIGNVYDGEILSIEQIENPSQANFNKLSGALNSKYGNKEHLIYMIFDITNMDSSYTVRRNYLNCLAIQMSRDKQEYKNVRILPLLAEASADNVNEVVSEQLEKIESKGGEGVMVNLGSRKYEHKRTDALLKVKSVYTMDMRVRDILPGTGKYAGLVGSLYCVAYDEESNCYFECNVGSGLSDLQRARWSDKPDEILGEVVEIAYFSLSQSESARGTNTYALRFPRFKGIRDDKIDTSIY